jgi:replicative DNA helicase
VYLASVIDFTKDVYFKNKDNKQIFSIIKQFYDARNELPNLTEIKQYCVNDIIKDSFKNVLVMFKTLDTNYNNDELYTNTEQFLKEKAVFNTLLDIASEVSKGNADTSVILDKFEKSCNISLQTDMGLDLYDKIDDVIKDILFVQETIPSEWPWLDDYIGGGFQRDGRALYVFAGETNIGKSIFLGNIAANIANQGKTVLLITLEMPEILYAKRICTNVSKIPMKTLHLETKALKHAIDEIKKNTPTSKILIKEFPPATVTPRQIQAFIKKIEDKGLKIDAIVLDYLNLLHSPIGNNSYERIKHVTEQIRAMSYIFNCPVISATQLNRSGFDIANPDLNTISECIEVNQLVQLVDGSFVKMKDIKPGDQIIANDGYKTVRQVHHKNIKKCYKITTKTGKQIVVSGDHKFPTNRGRLSITDGLSVADKLNVRTSTVSANPTLKSSV